LHADGEFVHNGRIKWPTHIFAKWPFCKRRLQNILGRQDDSTEVKVWLSAATLVIATLVINLWEKNLNYLIQAAVGMGLATIIGAFYPCVGHSQTPASSSEVHDGQHDFDFNIGVWHTHIKRILDPFANGSESVELNGTVTVRKVWDGKAELEEIEADGPKGHWEGLTLFLYNPSAHQWSQSFANSKVGTLSSNIGEFRDGRVLLIGQDTVNDKTILVRAMWSNIKPDSHQYEESYSNDGGTTWVRSFIANLTRMK
jgi:hypothetical protein